MKIKFLTLNVFLGEFFARAIKFIKKENPDIFVLQEVYDGRNDSLDRKHRSLKILVKEFSGYNYAYSPMFFRRISGYKVDIGNAIFSKQTIKSTETKFIYRHYTERKAETVEQFFLTPRNLQCSVIHAPENPINVFNLHGVWGIDGKDNKARLRMSEAIVNQIKNKKRVILAGDMNVAPETQTIRNVENHLVNVFKGELKSTFNMKRKISFTRATSWRDNKGFETAVVDMIFVSPDIKVTDHYCPKVDVSDHFPLVVVLEI